MADKRETERQTLPKATLHKAYDFIDVILINTSIFSHNTPVLRSRTHAGLGYLIDNASCHKPC